MGYRRTQEACLSRAGAAGGKHRRLLSFARHARRRPARSLHHARPADQPGCAKHPPGGTASGAAVPVQYLYYVADLLRGDWGYSRTAAQPCSTRYSGACRRPSSSRSSRSAQRRDRGTRRHRRGHARDRAPDVAVRVVSITGISFPVFWLGIILQLVFFYYLGQLGLPNLPSRGRVDDLVALQHPLGSVTGFYLIDSLVTREPAVFRERLASPGPSRLHAEPDRPGGRRQDHAGEHAGGARQDYILLARSKGLPARIIIMRHALRTRSPRC